MRAVTVISLLFVLSGCGAEVERVEAPPTKPAMSADEKAIRETLKRYVEATRANDPKGVCAVTAREVIDQIEQFGTTCESFVAKGTREGGKQYTLTTTSVVIKGDRAMTRGQAVESDGPRDGDQPLVRENGRWLLTTKTG
jgi:ketosteroid isomerase-like protein